MTAHQRIRGKPFNQQIVAFAEQILFNHTGSAVVTFRSIRRRNMEGSIRRRNIEERWNREKLLGIFGNPWSLKDGCVAVDPDPAAPARHMPMVNQEVKAEPTVTRTRNGARQTHLHHEKDGV